MDRLIDLDELCLALNARRASWFGVGLTLGEFTWRDAAASLPQPLVTDRAQVADPDSLGLIIVTSGDVEAKLVFWSGGWADLDVVVGDAVSTENPVFDDVEGAAAIAEDLAVRLAEAEADADDSTNCGPRGGLTTQG